LNSDEPFSPYGEKAIEIAGLIERNRMHPDFAGWMANLEFDAPDHQGIIEAAEHYLFNCQEP